jgi:hypothetical protein
VRATIHSEEKPTLHQEEKEQAQERKIERIQSKERSEAAIQSAVKYLQS